MPAWWVIWLFPKDAKGPLPGVLVVHEWKGLDGYAKRRAEQLAELGYVAFAADIYGDGKIAADAKGSGRAGRFVQKGSSVAAGADGRRSGDAQGRNPAW